MNSKLRRRAERNHSQKKDAVITIRESDLERRISKGIVQGVDVANCLWALTLNSMFGFGTVRNNRAIDGVMKQFECLAQGWLSGADLDKWLKDNNINHRGTNKIMPDLNDNDARG